MMDDVASLHSENFMRRTGGVDDYASAGMMLSGTFSMHWVLLIERTGADGAVSRGPVIGFRCHRHYGVSGGAATMTARIIDERSIGPPIWRGLLRRFPPATPRHFRQWATRGTHGRGVRGFLPSRFRDVAADDMATAR